METVEFLDTCIGNDQNVLKSFALEANGNQEKILRYLTDTFRPEDSVLAEIRERSKSHGLPAIQVGSMDGLHLEILTRSCSALKAVEIR